MNQDVTDLTSVPPGATTVCPRWEWRVFDEYLPLPEGLATAKSEPDAESDETYLLGATKTLNVKIRNHQFDIKLLEEVDASGLERWRPLVTLSFPLTPEQIARIERLLHVASPVAPTGPLEEPAFLRLVATMEPGIQIVPITKNRTRFSIDACAGERVVLKVGDRRLESVALEDQRPERVTGAMRRLGLAGRENTSYPTALTALLAAGACHPSPSHPENI